MSADTRPDADGLHRSLGGRIVAHPDVGKFPVLFLDCDGVIAPGNGNAIDRQALERVADTVHLAHAVVVLCSDRVRDPGFYDEIVDAGLQPHCLRGQCAPDDDEFAAYLPTFYGPNTGLWAGMRATSTKVKRVVMWLDFAQSKGLCPPAWCVLDDAHTFASDWRTCSVHVQPTGELVSDAELYRVWTILSRRLPHSARSRL